MVIGETLPLGTVLKIDDPPTLFPSNGWISLSGPLDSDTLFLILPR